MSLEDDIGDVPSDITPGQTGHIGHSELYRAIFDAVEAGSSRRLATNGESSPDIQGRADDLLWSASGDVILQRGAIRGVQETSSAVSVNRGLIVSGQSAYADRLRMASDFPTSGVLLTFAVDGSTPAGLLLEENHLPGAGLRHIGFDGRERTIAAHAIKTDFFDRMNWDDILVRNVAGSALIAHKSLRECDIKGFKTWLCGRANLNPVINLTENGDGTTDGHNLLKFIGGELAYSCGDHVWINSPNGGVSVARTTMFFGMVMHGLNEWIDEHIDVVGGGPFLIGTEGNISARFRVSNGRAIALIGCRMILPGRGQPLILIDDAGLGTPANSTLIVSGCSLSTGRVAPCSGRTGFSASAAADTITAVAIPGTSSVRHHLSTGSRLRFAGVLPSPLVAGDDYYAIRVDAASFKVASSRANAAAGTAVDLTTGGDFAASTYTQQDIGVTGAGSPSIVCADHRFSTGARVQIASDGGSVPTGLDAANGSGTASTPGLDAHDYFVIRVNADLIQLASSRANAEAGTAVSFTGSGSGVLYLIPQVFFFEVGEGTLTLGPNQYDTVPNRAYVRLEPGGAVNYLLEQQMSVGTTVPFVESYDGAPVQTLSAGGNVDLGNNLASLLGKTAGGDFVQLARVSSGGTALLGNPGLVSGVNAQVIGDTAADLMFGANVGVRAQAAADGETALLVRRNVGGSFSLQRVSMGATDSGGSGFKVLRVPN